MCHNPVSQRDKVDTGFPANCELAPRQAFLLMNVLREFFGQHRDHDREWDILLQSGLDIAYQNSGMLAVGIDLESRGKDILLHCQVNSCLATDFSGKHFSARCRLCVIELAKEVSDFSVICLQ
jgi:hypothetical protein